MYEYIFLCVKTGHLEPVTVGTEPNRSRAESILYQRVTKESFYYYDLLRVKKDQVTIYENEYLNERLKREQEQK